MRQSNIIFGTLLLAFMVYITMRGQLPGYLNLFTKKGAPTSSSSSSSSSGSSSLLGMLGSLSGSSPSGSSFGGPDTSSDTDTLSSVADSIDI